MPRIYKRGNVWWIDYRLGGKRIRKPAGRLKKYAKLALADIEVRIAKNEAGLPIEYPIQDWVDQFVEYIEAHLRPRIVERYKHALRWFFEFCHPLPSQPYYLTDITPQIIESYKAHRLKIRKRKTVNNEVATLRRFFNLAIERGYLQKNPCEKIAMLKVTDSRIPGSSQGKSSSGYMKRWVIRAGPSSASSQTPDCDGESCDISNRPTLI